MFDSCEKLHKTSKQKLFYWLCLLWARQNYIMQNKKMFLFHRVVSDFALKQKQNVFVSVSFLWFGSETKTKCFCFTQFTMIVFALSETELHNAKQKNVFVSPRCWWICIETKTKCFCFSQFSVIWQWFHSVYMILHWNKNKMFLFHSVYNDFAVKQKQNVFVSLSFCDLAVKQKQNVFVSLHFFWPCWHSIHYYIIANKTKSMMLG